MPARLTPRGLSLFQLLAVACVLAGGTLVWLYATRISGEFIYITPDPDAIWISSTRPAGLEPVRVPRDRPVTARFAHAFRVGDPAGPVRIRLRAVREIELFVNDEPVPLPDRAAARWKRESVVDVTDRIVPGVNHVTAVVGNLEGPPLLWLTLEGLPQRVATGLGWWIERGDERRPARLAIDVHEHPQARILPTTFDGLRARALPIGLGFLLFALPVWIVPSRWRVSLARHAVPLAMGAVTLFWLVLFVEKAIHFPGNLGYDVQGHYAYLRFLAEERRLPVATDGWSMFHPPLYYVVTALLRGATRATDGSPLDRILIHLLPMAAGLGSALLAGRIATRVAPGETAVGALAVLCAGLLPMNVYLSTFVSNEPVHAGLLSLVLFVACDALAAPRASARKLVALSAAAAAALLTKTTSLPVVLCAFGFVGVKLWWVEGRSLARTVLTLSAVVGAAALASGWFYARNLVRFGNAFVTNYDLPDATFWISPGFHTPEWYRGFGEALVRPFFASYASFLDGFYSTFWGDGQASGRLGVQYPSPFWDYDAMAAGYLLAAPATALMLVGFGIAAARAARGTDLGRRLALSLLVTVACGMTFLVLLTTLRYPHYALPKAFYALPAVTAYALALALGAAAADRGLRDGVGGVISRLLRSGLHGWGGAFAVALLLAYLQRGIEG